MSSTVTRFSNRVENYVKYRPGYPLEVLQLFRDEMNLTRDSVIADIGSGTGISSRLFLENGNTVYGVEPNDAMRCAAENYLQEFPNFRSANGTAENTGLQDNSVDFVIAAQAFHWFDREKANREFSRILKPGGHIVLMWNERRLDATPFLREYEQFLLRYANDYEKVRHENINEEILREFFDRSFSRATFENVQVFDFEGLKGRMLSASYMPCEGDERLPEIVDELHELFTKHVENDKIKVFYDTNVYYSQV